MIFCSKIFESRILFAFSCLALALIPFRTLAAGKSHSAHKAHVHGTAQVNVVGEANTVTIALESPADGIYGFEHEAKKPEDIKKRDEAVEKLKKSADTMFVLDSNLGCRLVTADVKPFVTESESKTGEKPVKKQKSEKGTHSEVHATFKFECAKPVSGSVLKFAVTSVFKALKKINVQVLSGEKQSGLMIRNDSGSVQL